MAKHACNICGAEVGFFQQIKMKDGNYVCRKCAAKTHPLFEPVNERTLEAFNEHLKQLEEGKILYEKLFLPRKKPADKSIKLKKIGGLEVAKDIGLIAAVKKRGGFFIWGGTNYYMVFRMADLFRYEYAPETSYGRVGKKPVKHFINYAFWDTPGCDNFKVEVITESSFISAARYFNDCFGLQRDVKSFTDSWKNQIANLKAAAKGVKALFTGNTDDGDKEEVIEELSEAAKKELFGDRTEWIAKADAAIKEALGK